MSTELSFVLKQFIRDFRSDAGEEDYLFCNVAGEASDRKCAELSIYDYNRSRGVNRTSIHAFRHTFAKCGYKITVMCLDCKKCWTCNFGYDQKLCEFI